MTLSKEDQQKKLLEEANKLPEQEFYTKWKLRDIDGMIDALRKEMSRQVGEMQRWKDYHEMGDPEGRLPYIKDEIFLVKKAIAHRNLYSKRKIEVNRHIQGKLEEAINAGDQKEVARLKAERDVKLNEMYGLIFKVFKIYVALKSELYVLGGENDEGED